MLVLIEDFNIIIAGRLNFPHTNLATLQKADGVCFVCN